MDKYKDKKVLVVGFGIEGQTLARFFSDQNAIVTVADKKLVEEFDPQLVEKHSSKGINWLTGEKYLDSLVNFDLIAFSPGLKRDAYQKIKSSGVKTTTQMQLFFENSPTKNLIGVTGTKGKGTTSTLIFEILKAAGKNVFLVGNIGEPALPLLKTLEKNDWVVLELSSYQLRDLTISPMIGVILNITHDHLDVHPDFEDYVNSKANIIRFQDQTDLAILNSDSKVVKDLVEIAPGHVGFFNQTLFNETGYELGLPGEHNRENAAAALAAVYFLDIEPKVLEKVFKEFKGLPHRLEEVATIDGVKYVDDSFATSPAPTIVGIHAFGQPKIVILGGFGKVEDFSELAAEISQNSSVKYVIAIGNSGHKIKHALEEVGFEAVEELLTNEVPVEMHAQLSKGEANIQRVVKLAREKANSGDIVLLSPSDSSFDWFKNYADRGEKFAEAVRGLKND